MRKTKNKLIRIIISAAFFTAAMIIFNITKIHKYIELFSFLAIYILISYDILLRAARNICHGKVFDENFLMAVASIGAFIMAQYSEAVAVMLFYQVGELFQNYAVGKSRKSISSLMDIRPDKAVIIKDGAEKTVNPEEVKIGDTIIVKAGEKLPLDGTVIEGKSSLDTSALTGESIPRSCAAGDAVLSGSINVGGVIKIKAEKEFYDSTVSKILDLVENASGKKAKAENFITKFASYYTPAVVFSALALAVIPSLITGQWLVWIKRALTFLVVSCPCALVISVPLGFFGGIGGASKKGILIKGANYIEMLSRANIFVFDKTGTLTKGSFEVKSVIPESEKDKILSLAAVAENGSLHPIAKSIIKAYGKEAEKGYEIEEIAGKGIKAVKTDDIILCGNKKLMEDNKIVFKENNGVGSVVYVAENGIYKGSILVADSIKNDAKETIDKLREQGCKTLMLTGDNDNIAKEIASELGLTDYKAGLLPADKVNELEKILAGKNPTDVAAFVGDGINDAPVLMRADVGISMGGVGSDSAIEASDIVLMYDKLSAIPEAKKICKKTLRLITENIWFAISVKIAVLILSAFGLANMWMAVFADVGVSIIAIINSMRAMRVK